MQKKPGKNPTQNPRKFLHVDDYHRSFPKPVRKILDELRKMIRALVPEAVETIRYNIPTFKLKKNLFHYAAYEKHIGFYPSSTPIRVFKTELKGYKTSKGAIQFPLDRPLPMGLIKKIILYRVAEEKEAEITRTKPRKVFHYYENGNLQARGSVIGGELHDYWEWFRRDGVIQRSGYFMKGKQTGTWTTYNKKGKAVTTEDFGKKSFRNKA